MMYRVVYLACHWFSDDTCETAEMSEEEFDHFKKFVSGLRCGEYKIIDVKQI